MTMGRDAEQQIDPAEIRPGGLAVFQASPETADGEPLVVGFIGPAWAIYEVFNEYLDWCLYAPATVTGTPAGASFALCRPDISPEDLVGQKPFVSWLRIDYEDLHDGASGATGNPDDIDETPRFTPHDKPKE